MSAATSSRTAVPWRSSRSWRSTDASMSSTSGLATMPACRVTRNTAQDSICSEGNSAGRWASTSCSTGRTRTPVPPGCGRTRTNRGRTGGISTEAKRRRPPSSRTPTARLIDRLAAGGKAFPGSETSGTSTGRIRSANSRAAVSRSSSLSSAQSQSSTPASPMSGPQPVRASLWRTSRRCTRSRTSSTRPGAAPAELRPGQLEELVEEQADVGQHPQPLRERRAVVF